ncbi:MAG TPA: hypothetical protein VMC05_11565 [Xanthobacteraceae bacterium]|nr:hypothetical protein [Xanthobacteraceae bacterium]
MTMRIQQGFCLALVLVAALAGPAVAQDYPGYPDTIMTPERGAGTHHGAKDRLTVAPPASHRHASLLGHEHFVGKLHRRPGVFVATRGSSGSVLPTPLPRTGLIPPERVSPPIFPAVPEAQGPTFVPGAPSLGAVPNLPHGPETFQDRASRCAFQLGLNNVPGTASSAYMSACLR